MDSPALITEYGKRVLGDLLRSSREAAGWSLEDLSVEIRNASGRKLSRTAVSNLERGYSTPAWDTLSILAAVGYVKDSTGRKLTAHDMFDIACEAIAYHHGQVAIIPRGAEVMGSEYKADA